MVSIFVTIVCITAIVYYTIKDKKNKTSKKIQDK